MKKNLKFVIFGILTMLFTISAGKSALRGDLLYTTVSFSAAIVCMIQVATDDGQTADEDKEEEQI